jgi:hypothetical protein
MPENIAVSPSPILVVGLARPLPSGMPWVWRLLDAAEPRLSELARATDSWVPEFRRSDPRRFRLSDVTPGRERVVLVSEAMTGGSAPGPLRGAPGERLTAIRVGPSQLTHPTRLRVVRHLAPRGAGGQAPLLPYWLEEDLPGRGLDVIRVPGEGASFDRTLEGLLRLLWESVRETGRAYERRVAA